MTAGSELAWEGKGPMVKMLDRMEMVLRGELPQPPIGALMGFQLTSIKPGESVIEFEAGERHANPMGTLHGGVLCDIADAAMGIAYASTLGGASMPQHPPETRSAPLPQNGAEST